MLTLDFWTTALDQPAVDCETAAKKGGIWLASKPRRGWNIDIGSPALRPPSKLFCLCCLVDLAGV